MEEKRRKKSRAKRSVWPRIEPRENKGGSTSWIVDAGRIGNTKRSRRIFDSKKDAEAHAAELRQLRDHGGLEAAALLTSKASLTDLLYAQKRAQALEYPLLKLLELAEKALKGELGNVPILKKPAVVFTVDEVISKFCDFLNFRRKHIANHNGEHAKISGQVLRKILKAHRSKPIHEVTLDHLIEALKASPPRSSAVWQKIIQRLFAFAVAEGRQFIFVDIAKSLGKADKPDPLGDPAILRNWEVRSLLYTAQSKPEFHILIPSLAVQLFSGLRLCECGKIDPKIC